MKDITEEVTKAAELTDVEEEIYKMMVENREVYIDSVSWGKTLSKEEKKNEGDKESDNNESSVDFWVWYDGVDVFS
ncbi:hypothetical protein FYJ27_08560 [Anaerosalibacter bizertensis]|uniref:Uncharacterized protein n=1 Tax=Anaerosalibacter bizertensis TaxID=932217 RepID=A0A844FIM3_9FIRM|nr:hypothetical protein [Anaerosalibacter bizertensis]MSS43778.1 hypothetical protein [Anaerosalibacter bizertensis]